MEGELFRLAPANERAGRRSIEPLGALAKNQGSGRGGQLRELCQGVRHGVIGLRFQFHPHQENPGGALGGIVNECFQIK